MFEAQLLMAHATDYTVYGPWMAAGGDAADVELEVVASDDNVRLKVEVYTKTNGLAGDGNDTGMTALDSTDAATYTGSTGSTLKDLMRYKYTVDDNDQGSNEGWILFRMKPPRFYDKV